MAVDLGIRDQISVIEGNVAVMRKAIKDTLKISSFDDLKGMRDDFLMMEAA